MVAKMRQRERLKSARFQERRYAASSHALARLIPIDYSNLVKPSLASSQVKVSGGTQTCTTELQANSSSSNQGHHYKSYSLTGPSASQLSQSVRDRLMLGSQSLPKPGSPEFTALFAAAHHRERGAGAGPVNASSFSPRVLKPSDGSLSDTCSNYAAPDLPGYYTPNSPYATSWMRHSNTYTPSGRSQGTYLTC